jgi:hypothetical protein
MQAAQRALVVMREKAANEAKSEFMSLMCHEVRTPLNGCLASAGAHSPCLHAPPLRCSISTTQIFNNKKNTSAAFFWSQS